MKGKWLMIVLSFALAAGLFGVLPAPRASAATIYTWFSPVTGSWTDPSKWNPPRVAPAADDILQFNSGGSFSVSGVPTQTIGRLLLSNNTAVGLVASASNTVLTISGGTGINLDVPPGTTLNVYSPSSFSIALSTGATGSVAGNMTFSDAAHKLTASDASGITFNSGASFTTGTGFTGNAFGSGTANSVVFASGSTYTHNAGSNPFSLTAPSSVVVFQPGSTAVYRTTTGYAATGRTFANLTVQNNTALSGSGAGDFQFQTLTVESGSSFTHSGSSTATVTIKGDISSAGTGNVSITSGSGGIQVNGGTTQTFGGGGGSGTLTFVSALTVASGTTLAASRTLTTSGGATINGSFQLNSNGFAAGGTWTYGSGATLVFNNTGSRYGVNTGHVYWPTSNGPTNVTIANTGGVQMGVSRTVAGTLTASAATSLELNNGNTLTAGGLSISNSSSLNLATATTGTTGALTVSGNVSVGTSGGLTLNSADLYVGGNWSNSGTFTPNSRAVFFNGTGTQTISKTGGETFAYLIVNKTANNIQLLNNVTVNATSGDVLQLLNTGGIDLNGNTLTLSGAGGNVLASGAARNIIGGSGSTVAFAGSKTVTSASSGTLSFGSNVLVTLSAGVNFGASLSTVNGTLRIDGGGAVTTNPPTYGGGSLLRYYSGGTYGRSTEWSATSGAGYPANVQISNNTTLNYPNGSTAARSMAGSLTVDSGSALYMDFGSPGLNNPLTVAGSVTLDGSLSLGDAVGGDLNVGGNWTFDTGANFFPNSRAVTFNGSSAQSIGGSTDTTFAYLTINNTSADTAGVSLERNQVVNTVLTLTDGMLKVAGFNLTLGTGASISGGSTTSMVVTDTDGSAGGDGFLCKRYSGNGSFTFPVGDASGTTEFSPSTLDFTSGSFNSGDNSACVQATDNVYSPIPANRASWLTRYWTVTSTNITSFSCNVSFTYVDADVSVVPPAAESSIRYQHSSDSGATWTQGALTDATNNILSGTVTSFSVHTGFSQSPTAVTLADFGAVQQGDFVLLTWETNSELNNRGFNLYRGTSDAAPDRQLNETLIPSQSQGNPGGFVYTWEDRADLVPGTTYFYWVEDVDVNGAATMHGPVSVDFAVPTAVTLNDVQASSVAASMPLTGVLLALLASLVGAVALLPRRFK